MRTLLITCLLASAAGAYTPEATSTGVPLRRTDVTGVKFLINQGVAAGILNADGAVMITADSDPVAALQAAAATWSNVPNSLVKFAPLDTTTAVNNPSDNQNVIVFLDTLENRSVVGSALAVTNVIFFTDGRIVESDIIFNPQATFSTNLAPKTYDLQSVATHEMGHALGGSHSGILAATMFQATVDESNSQIRLSADDAAFASDAYAAPSAADALATLSGKITLTTGEFVPGALLVAADPSTGVTVGGLSSVTDGTYSMKVPRGSYLLYAEPADGPVYPANLYLPDSAVNALFQTAFFGGNAAPQLIDLTSGKAAADIAVAGGPAPFDVYYLGTGIAAGSGDATFLSGVSLLTAGKAVDLILSGPGLDAPVTQDEVQLLGPGLVIRPGSIRIDSKININGTRPIRLTVDVAPRTDPMIASVVVIKNSVVVAFSGSLLVTPPKN
jgi:hypothetical protein